MNENNFLTAKVRWVAWLAAPILLFVPMLFIPRVVIWGNSDALFYGNILAMISDSVRAGDFFPRWLAAANAGFGSPVMMFYAPLPYLLTALVTLPFTSFHPDSITQLIVGMYASQVVSGWAAYAWLKRNFSERIAFIGSLLFVLLPYKLVYIYLHNNLAQLWAIAFLPLWMIAAEELAAGSRRAIGWYALAFAAVYFCHGVTVIAFAAVPAAYVLFSARRSLAGNVVSLTAAHILAVMMCAMQALPGHMLMQAIHAERFFAGKYSWRDNFFHVDVMLCAYYGIIAMLVGVALWRIPSLFKDARARQSILWIAALCVVLFLTQRASSFLWEHFTPLQYLQFPAARLHAVALMAAVYLSCVWLTHFKAMLPLSPTLYRPSTLIALIAAFGLLTVIQLTRIKADHENFNPDYLGAAQEARLVITNPDSLFETRWGCIPAKQVYNLFTHNTVPADVRVAQGNGTVSDVSWNPPSQITFKADIQSGSAKLVLRQCYFPLWQAVDEAGHAIAVDPDNTNGALALVLPKGPHNVMITLGNSLSEGVARAVALIALVISIMLICAREKQK